MNPSTYFLCKAYPHTGPSRAGLDGPGGGKPCSSVERCKSKAPHTASVRDTIGLGYALSVFMPVQGTLLGLVGQTRGSNAPTSTTECMTPNCVYNMARLRSVVGGAFAGGRSSWVV